LERNVTNYNAHKNALSAGNEPTEEYNELRQEIETLREACETANRNSTVFTHIAHALARDYTDLFYVNMETDEYIEYHTDDERGVLVESRRASDFFESCSREGRMFVHPDDQEQFVTAMKRDFLSNALDHCKVFKMTYRRIKYGRVFYVQMKVSRMEDDNRFIVIAVSDIDELVKKRRMEEKIQEERIIYARLHALTGNFLVVYVVDPETGSFHEFSSSDDYSKNYPQEEYGPDFFAKGRAEAVKFVHPEDREQFLAIFTRDNIMSEIERTGIFSYGYRLIRGNTPVYVQLKAAMVDEKEGPRLIVGINDIDTHVRQEKVLKKRLVKAESKATIDALTGVRNKYAYLEAEADIDRRIAEHAADPFAVVMLDINDLKLINDTKGHQAGDQHICDACKIICNVFKHSPVFRIGGDEFTVIAQGEDYDCLAERIAAMSAQNAEAIKNGGVVIACGAAEFADDETVAEVFERADHNMYENKNRLKSGNAS